MLSALFRVAFASLRTVPDLNLRMAGDPGLRSYFYMYMHEI
jgi:hypothetical protein